MDQPVSVDPVDGAAAAPATGAPLVAPDAPQSAWIDLGIRSVAWGAGRMGRIRPVRRAVVRIAERVLRQNHVPDKSAALRPAGSENDRLAMGMAILRTFEQVIAEGRLNDNSLRTALQILIGDNLIRHGDLGAQQRFCAENGMTPPSFLAIAPGKACNLRCVGCYADAGQTREKLPYATFERIVREAHDLWGVRFFVIVGGEPMVYRDAGKGLLDLAERYRDCFFLMYTNGTLIDDAVARRLAALGNVTPALSVEGLQAPTDERRGAGVFDQILAAMDRLRRERVLFGVSLTATRHNIDDLLSDEVIDLLFREKGAFYGWIFHYMPIGRAFTLDLMPTAEQRVRLRERMWYLIRERDVFLADFWNSGSVTDGCISAGRPGGYMYIDWNGALSPCVFVPYAPVNIQTLYSQGKTLSDAWREPFFASLRDWQRDFGFQRAPDDTRPRGNWLMSCPIRDHYATFRNLVNLHEPEPTDANAAAALLDPAYAQGMEEYAQDLARRFEPVWEAEYLKGS